MNSQQFDEWWNSDKPELAKNPYREDSAAYWAWAGWQASAAAERNRIWTQDHWTEYERAIVAAEREACAKVCEAIARDTYGMNNLHEYGECAAAIRARGQAS